MPEDSYIKKSRSLAAVSSKHILLASRVVLVTGNLRAGIDLQQLPSFQESFPISIFQIIM